MDFTSTVEDIDAVTKKIKISVPAEVVAKEFDSALNKISRSVRIKGFREGKAPRDLVQRVYGERVQAEVRQELIETALRDSAKKHDLSIVGSPAVNLSNLESGKDFEFAADISIYPKPEIAPYDQMEITIAKGEVKDEDVEKVVDYLRKSRATLKPLEGRTTLEKGDVGQGEFVLFEEGGTPGKAEPYSFCLGEDQLPKEVDAVLEGMAVGETREVSVENPGPNGEPPQKITYRCTLKGLSERILPELDDAFAKQVEPGVETVLEMKLKVRGNLEKEKDREATSELQAAIIAKLTEANQFAVPQALIDEEIRGILVSRGFIDPRKMDPEKLPMDIFRKEVGEMALKRVRAAIAVDRIAEKEGIKIEKDDVEKTVQSAAQSMNVSVQEAQQRMFQKDRAVQSMVEIVRQKTLEWLQAHAKVTYSSKEAIKTA